MVEMMFSVLVIGVLLSLLIGGVRLATAYAKSTTDRQAVNTIKVGVDTFRQDFGFFPPLVRDQAVTSAASTRPAGGGETAIDVYLMSNPAHVLVLRPAAVVINAANPFDDKRYSNRTLAYYLAGALAVPLVAANPNVPVDGFSGPGLYKPKSDGTFDIPVNVRTSSTDRARVGTAYQPFIELARSSPRLVASTETAKIEEVEVRDRGNITIRYYRWLNGAPDPARPGEFIVNTLADLRVPTMVGRDANVPAFVGWPTPEDRDLNKNIALRDATYAIVAAGPNKAYGDEPIAELGSLMGVRTDAMSADDQLKLRIRAEKDNIIEVGK